MAISDLRKVGDRFFMIDTDNYWPTPVGPFIVMEEHNTYVIVRLLGTSIRKTVSNDVHKYSSWQHACEAIIAQYQANKENLDKQIAYMREMAEEPTGRITD